MNATRILHLTDLHFGYRFSQGKWDAIATHVEKNRPDAVVITGDLVNSPWRWELKAARQRLEALSGVLNPAGKVQQKCEIFLVPGNHDTRISGLIALDWLVLGALVLFGAGAWLAWRQLWGPASVMLVPALLLGMLRAMVSKNLKGYFGDMLIKEPQRIAGLPVGIIPLDSATGNALGAQGRVQNDISNVLQKLFNQAGAADVFWIAAVHHHPLPIPYDDAWEPVMIMENAGTVLKELVSHGVPLILHGHKHHQHFARYFVHTRERGSREIAVLSGGTPTEKEVPAPNFHSFNEIIVASHSKAEAIVYEAEAKGSFFVSRSFSVLSDDMQAQRRLSGTPGAGKFLAARMVGTVAIDSFGNARYSEEFFGLKSTEVASLLPYDFSLGCSRGEIIAGNAACFGNNGPSIVHAFKRVNEHRATYEISFVPQLQPNEQAVDFHIEYYVANFCALNSLQFRHIYKSNSNMEFVKFSAPREIAVSEYYFQVRYPENLPLPGKITLEMAVGGSDAEPVWGPIPNSEIILVRASPAVMVRIPAPTPGAVYRLHWLVAHVEEETNAQQRLFEHALTRLDADVLFTVREEIKTALEAGLLAAIQTFSLSSETDPEHALKASTASFYIFDKDKGHLRRLVALGRNPKGGRSEYEYGLGLPGLAFKAKAMFIYDRRQRRPNLYGDYCCPPAEGIAENQSEDCLVVPLYCDSDIETDASGKHSFKGQPYGVLRMAFLGLEGKLAFQTATDDVSQAKFRLVVCKLMHNLVAGSILAHMKKEA
jgi:3',5'-cyclic AMP phosphodiesterase CpdA